MIRRRAFWTKAVLLGLCLKPTVVHADLIQGNALPPSPQTASPRTSNAPASAIVPGETRENEPSGQAESQPPLLSEKGHLAFSTASTASRSQAPAPADPRMRSGRDSVVSDPQNSSASKNYTIPEPTSLVLVVTGLIGLAARRKLRKAMTAPE
jgi:hypothetical protein